MGQLILCQGKQAKHPFEIESASIHIYSAEELCYYILHHADFVDQGIFSEKLCKWLDEETRMPELAYELTEILHKKKNIFNFMSTLLLTVGYATKQETEAVLEQLKILESKTPQEIAKMRADKLVEQERYRAGIEDYQLILKDDEVEDPMLKGAIYHNMGTAYARLYLYEAAADCYEKAFALNMNPESVREYMHAIRYVSGDAGFGDSVKVIQEDKLQEMKEQLNHILQSEEAKLEKTKFYQMEELQKEGKIDSFFEVLRQQIEQWKISYLEMTEV